ncbi:hypothetical protein BGP79_11790 [Tersicoccus sp. Bi-70]|nr:hypothetical protein BGP79_11790 [Tersicoccus sp. Bi-70]
MTMVWSVRLPIPSRVCRMTSLQRSSRRKGWSWPYVRVAGRELYFGHALIDVWHVEPGGRDAGEVCRYRDHWKHPGHWRLRYPMAHRLQRRLFTVCSWCSEPGSKGDSVNTGHGWDEDHSPAHWWQSERGLYHSACSSAQHAHQMCSCRTPSPNPAPGRHACTVCGLFLKYDGNPERDVYRLTKRLVLPGRRPSPEARDAIRTAWEEQRRSGRG